jgi:hypothetical protein
MFYKRRRKSDLHFSEASNFLALLTILGISYNFRFFFRFHENEYCSSHTILPFWHIGITSETIYSHSDLSKG